MAKEQAKPLLKPGATSKLLGVSTVTIRKYTREFQEFLSPSARNETSRHFTPEDIQVLKVARRLLGEGFTYEETRQLLPERLPIEGEILEDMEPEEQEEPRQEPPGAIAPIEFFQLYAKAKDETIEILQEENERLRHEIEYLRMPFFVKWFRKPRAE